MITSSNIVNLLSKLPIRPNNSSPNSSSIIVGVAEVAHTFALESHALGAHNVLNFSSILLRRCSCKRKICAGGKGPKICRVLGSIKSLEDGCTTAFP